MRALGLRTKILLPVAVIIFIVLGSSTIVYINNLRRDYIEAVEWRAEALIQSLAIDIADAYKYIPNVQELLEAENLRCVQLYEANKNLTHVALINSSGMISAHNDYRVLKTFIENPRLLTQLQKQEQATILEGNIYHTLIPIFGLQDKAYLGTVDIGFPKKTVDERVKNILMSAAKLLVLSLFLAFLAISIIIQRFITKPIKQLVDLGQQLASGDLVEVPHIAKHGDEIAVLRAAFSEISTYLHHIADVASHISDGMLDSQVHVRSKQDVLGNAVHKMYEYLNNLAGIATAIAEGDLTTEVDIRSAEDMFGRIMLSMTEGLRTLISQTRISAEQIATTGTEIASLANRDIGIVRNVNGSMEQMVSTMSEVGASIEEVTHNTENLSSSVEQTTTSVAQMAASVRQIASDTSKLTQQTDQTIVFLNEAVETLGGIVEHTDVSKELSLETLQDATEGQNAVEQVMTSMETIHQAVDMAVESIARFAERSQDIGTILEVIEDITHQTSLLALNASIIAAQAGSHGRAFAVVADEIKSLAQGVGSSTQDIAAIVQTLQEDTKSVVRTIHEGAENVKQGMEHTQQARGTLKKIMSSSHRSSSVVTEIAETLHSLLRNSRKIAMAMKRVSAMTNDIKRATSEQQTSTVQINNAIEHINEMSSQIHLATAEQTAGVRQLLEMAQDVTELAGQNQDSSQHIVSTTEELSAQSGILLNSIDRFKLNA